MTSRGGAASTSASSSSSSTSGDGSNSLALSYLSLFGCGVAIGVSASRILLLRQRQLSARRATKRRGEQAPSRDEDEEEEEECRRRRTSSQALSSASSKTLYATDDIVREHFTRNVQFFGQLGQEHIADAFVVVVGLGGVGSHCASMLLRSGVRKLRVVDFDQVSLSSLNRHAGSDERGRGEAESGGVEETLREDFSGGRD